MDNIKLTATRTVMIEGRKVFDSVPVNVNIDGWQGQGVEYEGGLLVYFPGLSLDGNFIAKYGA